MYVFMDINMYIRIHVYMCIHVCIFVHICAQRIDKKLTTVVVAQKLVGCARMGELVLEQLKQSQPKSTAVLS